jgi:pyruvate formate lyase activating enzyme
VQVVEVTGASVATIFNVQRFCVHDGPGIRTTVFFKGCPLRCHWCQNPESLRRSRELLFYADRCRESRRCLASCPQNALSMTLERVEWSRCDACGDCVDVCDFGAYEIVGREVTVGELLAEVARDKPFYRQTGGGLTLSGGEATLQLDFLSELVRGCRERDIPVGLQTCGVFRWEVFEPLASAFQFIHFDLKVMDPARHRRFTGGDNRSVLANARHLVEGNYPVVFRTPIIPGYTDDEENLAAIAEFLSEIERPRLDLLAYHSLGEVKKARLGWPVPPLERIDSRTVQMRLRDAEQYLRARGINAVNRG